jgi:hypothetical protein
VSAQSLPSLFNLNLNRAFKRSVAKYFDETNEAIIPAMYHLHRGLASLTTSSFSVPAFNAPDRSGTSVQIGDKILQIAAIKDMAIAMQKEIDEDLHKLTFGLGHCQLPVHVYDSPRETKAGYCFLDDPANKFAAQSELLLRAVLKDRASPVPFFVVDSNNKVIWLPGPCHEYINLSFDVMMKLFVVTHITAGSPGRGSELSSQLLRNMSGGSIRSIFVLFNIFLLMGTHNKTSHVSNQDKNIVRAPWQPLAQQWITMLARVRPFVVTLQLYFRGTRLGHNAHYYIYHGVHHPVTTSDLSKALAYHTHRHLGILITLKQWRHIVSWVVADNYRLFQHAHLQTEAVHVGFGHEATTASGSYASDLRLPVEIDKTIFFTTIKNGATWQLIVGLGKELFHRLSQGDQHRNHIISEITAALNPSLLPMTDAPPVPEPSTSVDHTVDRLLHLMLPRITTAMNRALAHAQAVFMHKTLPLLQHSTIIPPNPTLVNPAWAYYLSQHRRQESTFRTHQGDALQAMHDNELSLLYITPTGEPLTHTHTRVPALTPRKDLEKQNPSFWQPNTAT